MMFTEPVRTQCGYRYRDASFNDFWVTSAPQTEAEAFAYFDRLLKWGKHPVYVEKREAGSSEFNMLPVQLVDGKVVPL